MPVVYVAGRVGLDTVVEGVWAGKKLPWPGGVNDSAFAAIYLRLGEEFGLRADVMWAQMLLETNDLKFGGQVRGGAYNWCGLKTRDGSAFADFETPLHGARAHFEHMAWYVKAKCKPGCGTNDTRHLGAHGSNGWVKTVNDLSGKWASSATYAEGIVARAKSVGL